MHLRTGSRKSSCRELTGNATTASSPPANDPPADAKQQGPTIVEEQNVTADSLQHERNKIETDLRGGSLTLVSAVRVNACWYVGHGFVEVCMVSCMCVRAVLEMICSFR